MTKKSEECIKIVSKFGNGMKCIAPRDFERFNKAGGKLSRCIICNRIAGTRLHAFVSKEKVGLLSYRLKPLNQFRLLAFSIKALLQTETMRRLRQPEMMFDGMAHDDENRRLTFQAFDFWYPGIGVKQMLRLELLNEAINEVKATWPHEAEFRVEWVEHLIVSFENEETARLYAEEMMRAGERGVIIKNPNGLYENMRSPNWVIME